MFKAKDLELLGISHDTNRKASEMMGQIEFCKTNVKAKILRIQIRDLMQKTRIKMRRLKTLIIKRDEA